MNDNLLDKESSIIVVLKYSGYETINRKIIKNLHWKLIFIIVMILNKYKRFDNVCNIKL